MSKDAFRFIPLLSKKPLDDFTPEEFKDYIRSLYHKPEPKKATPKKKPFSFNVNKKGTLIVRINREPEWLSREEIEVIAKGAGQTVNDVWLKLVTKRGVKISTQEAEEKIKRDLDELPF